MAKVIAYCSFEAKLFVSLCFLSFFKIHTACKPEASLEIVDVENDRHREFVVLNRNRLNL